jgi:hypothetical protein
MDNLEKQLANLPQAKLSYWADRKIKCKLYAFIIGKNCRQFLGHFVLANVVLRRTLAIAMIVIMIVGGTSFYAYANDSLTEGDVLYPLKRAVETVEKQVAFSQPAKIKTHEKLAERRLHEAALLSQADATAEPGRDSEQMHERIKKSLDEAVAETGSAVEQAKATGDDKTGPEAAERARDKEPKQSERLEAIAKNADLRHDEDLIKKVRETKEAMRQYRRELGKDEDREDKTKPKEEDKPSDQTKESAGDDVPEVRGSKIKTPVEDRRQEERDQRRQEEEAESKESD